MSDNVTANPGSGGPSFVTEDIGSGVQLPVTKIAYGVHGEKITVDEDHPLPVTLGLTDIELRASAVPVSASALPLPTGASTEATLAAMSAKLDGVLDVSTGLDQGLTDTQLRATPVPVSITGSIPVTVASAIEITNDAGNAIPVSASTLPLPTGASTEATLAGMSAKLDGVLDVDTGLAQPLTDAQLRADPIPVTDSMMQSLQETIDTLLTVAQMMLRAQARVDVTGRAVVNGSEVTQPVSGTVTSNIGTGTLAAVTAVTNLTQISGQPVPYIGYDRPPHIYDNIKVT